MTLRSTLRAAAILIFCVFASAQDDADRTAIHQTIAAISKFPRTKDLFTADFDSASTLQQFWQGKKLRYAIDLSAPKPASPSSPSVTPTIVISPEPWGEATLGMPGQPVEIVNPRIETKSIRFLAPGVAMTDASLIYVESPEKTQTTPLLILLKKDSTTWKIASLRILAP